MPVYVCDEHLLAYEKPNALKGHWLKAHGGDTPPESGERDAVPEGYELRQTKPPKAKKGVPSESDDPRYAGSEPEAPPAYDRAPVVRTSTAAAPAPEEEQDEDVTLLRKLMRGSSVPEKEIDDACKGFAIYPQLREDAASLDRWLRAKIKNRRAHDDIPLMVNAFLAAKQEEGGAPAGGPAYYPPARPPAPAPNPYYRGAGPAMYGGYGSPYPSFYPPPYQLPPSRGRGEGEDEGNPEIDELKGAVAQISQQLVEERAAREQEKREAAEAERERQHQAELKALNDKIDAITASKAEERTGTVATAAQQQMERLLDELQKQREESAAYRKMLEDQRLEELKKSNLELQRQLVEVRHEVSTKSTTGKTIEDLAGDLGPALIDKVSDGVDKASTDLSELRKDVAKILGQQGTANQANGAQPAAPKKPAKSIDEIAKQGDEENKILDAIDAAKKAESAAPAAVDAAATPAQNGAGSPAAAPAPGAPPPTVPDFQVTRLSPEEEKALDAKLTTAKP